MQSVYISCYSRKTLQVYNNHSFLVAGKLVFLLDPTQIGIIDKRCNERYAIWGRVFHNVLK